jgi:cytochrome c oxidase assembly protein subunit 15
LANSSSISYKLSLVAVVLAFIVVLLGAYTRLVDAGLGCPDWPGCYGFLTVPEALHDVKTATEAFPDAPVEADKAWPEMIHRYFAGSLGSSHRFCE